ncbi:MAG: AsmA family protein [Planctomycetota bacterium]|jgi:uncharacterized protein involved in outer membrane biogenesis
MTKEKKKKGGKLKKIITFILILFLVLIVAGILIFNLWGDTMIRAGLIAGTSKALQVDVRLESVSTALLRGQVELTNLEIDNPEGFHHETFMTLGYGYIDLDMHSLLTDTVVIDKMQFDDITIVLEQEKKTSNINVLINNLPSPDKDETPDSDTDETPDSDTDEPGSGEAKDLQITTLEINGITVKAELLPIDGRADTVTFKLAPIKLENIGTTEKVDTKELMSKIFASIAGGIAEQGKGLLPTEMIGDISEDLAKHGGELLKAGEDLGKGAVEALDSLNPFKKKKEETPEEK